MFNIMAVVFAVEAFSLFYDALGGMSTMNTKDKGLGFGVRCYLGRWYWKICRRCSKQSRNILWC